MRGTPLAPVMRGTPLVVLVALGLGLVTSACGGTSRGSATGSLPGEAATAEGEPVSRDALIGEYECRFVRGEVELEPLVCAIRTAEDGTLRFEQPGGQVRLAGTVTPSEPGFTLTGDIQCAAEPCPSAGTRELVFFTQREGAYSAVVPLPGGELLNIDLVRR